MLNKGHEVVWNSTWIITNTATWICTNRIEVPQQYDFPLRVRMVDISANIFSEELKNKSI